MDFNELKENSTLDKERLRERMEKDWLEYVTERLKDIGARFGIKTDGGKVKSRRIR